MIMLLVDYTRLHELATCLYIIYAIMPSMLLKAQLSLEFVS